MEGLLGQLDGVGPSAENQEIKQRRYVGDEADRQVLGDGCSLVVITHKALVMEANRYLNPPSLSSSGLLDLGSQLLTMLLQDGSLVELAGSVAKDLMGKELVVRDEELETL